MILCKLMAEHDVGGGRIVMGGTMFRVAKDRMIWRVIFAHVLRIHSV